MSIATTSNKVINQGNGATTVFNFGFSVRQASDIKCVYVDAFGNETDVTANCVIALNAVAPGAQWALGGTVTYNPGNVPIGNGTQLVVLRIQPFTQGTVFANQGGNFPAVTEQTADLLEMTLQQLQETLTRVPFISQGKDASQYTLNLIPVANALLGWDATGKVLGAVATGGINIAIPVTVAQGGTNAVTAAAARGNLNLSGATSTMMQNPVMKNGTLVATVNANALTIAIKTAAGADPSAADPVDIMFRDVNGALGDFALLTLTAATSLVVPNGATLGTANAVPFRFWIVGFNDGGVFRLGVINCIHTVAGVGTGRDVTAIAGLRDDAFASATNPVANADLTIYANANVATKAIRVLGYLEYSAGLAAAGAYNIAPTKIQLYGSGISLPGQPVATVRLDTGAVATGTTTVPADDTIPQNTEGDQYMALAITPSSAANVLMVSANAFFVHNFAGTLTLISSLFQDAAANALKVGWGTPPTANNAVFIPLSAMVLAGVTVATTFKYRDGPSGAATVTFNGATAGSRFFGGTMDSCMQITEVQG